MWAFWENDKGEWGRGWGWKSWKLLSANKYMVRMKEFDNLRPLKNLLGIPVWWCPEKHSLCSEGCVWLFGKGHCWGILFPSSAQIRTQNQDMTRQRDSQTGPSLYSRAFSSHHPLPLDRSTNPRYVRRACCYFFHYIWYGFKSRF